MYYIGFLKESKKHAVIFRSLKKPTKDDYSYFLKVIGPYTSWDMAKVGLKRFKGYKENPVIDPISERDISDALRLTKKVYEMYRVVRKKNPGNEHYLKFLQYVAQLENHVVGSRQYVDVLAKAYAHLKAAKAAR